VDAVGAVGTRAVADGDLAFGEVLIELGPFVVGDGPVLVSGSLFAATIYAWGLRRREAAMLDVTDWGPNAKAPQFGRFGVVNVRYGRASRGGAPRQRTVLTVMGWAAEAVAEWVSEIRPAYKPGPARMLWPTERGARVASSAINARFVAYRDAVGLDAVLSPHCLRHSFITHQLEDGVDQLFVQQQVGHRWGSSTAGYTKVGSDYLQVALTRALQPAWDSPDGGTAAGDR
jgi:site-specific recombinase XerD